MTSVEYSDKNNNEALIQEMHQIPKEVKPLTAIFQKEQEIVKHIEDNGGVVTTIHSETISKRRFKRRRAKELKRLAKKHNVGVDAISLKYCEQTITNSIVLSGASNSEQLKENLKLNSFTLSNDEIETLNSLKVSTDSYWSERKKLQWN